MSFIKKESRRFFVFGIIIIITGASIIPSVLSIKTDTYNPLNLLNSFDGYVLFTPEFSKNTYMINSEGQIVHMWESNYIQAFGAYLLENGDLLRSDLPYVNPTFMGGGVTGRVEKFDWSSSLIWKFEYSNENYCLHHDIEPLPNGNILMTAWEYKTAEQAIQAGINPDSIPFGQIWPEYIIEVEPTGSRGGKIVWEWHVWDHLIQDYNPFKNNYGVVADHPELIDINFGQTPILGDWNHINSIDYNEDLDQILLSSRGNSEIWVIDHSTTTKEAAGHTGGNSGKGGDLLYRWGNPGAYRAGTADDQKLFAQHDAHWIEEGCPGEGNILIFNNGNNRPGVDYSSVDEIVPPVDSNGNYNLAPGSAFGPSAPVWIYMADYPYDFYAAHLSGAQRLPNGNTLICNGPIGRFIEVTTENEKVWQYDNPYPNSIQNDVFKIQYIPIEVPPPEEPDLNCEGSINWNNVKAGEILYDSFQIENIGDTYSFLDWTIESYPNWGSWVFSSEYGENLTPEDGLVTVNVTIFLPNKTNERFDGSLRIGNKNNPSDFDIVPIHIKTSVNINHISSSYNQYINRLNQKLLFFIEEVIKLPYLRNIFYAFFKEPLLK